MGKISRIAATASVFFVLAGGAASAQDIKNTGTGSNNSTSTSTTNSSNVVCINNVLISNGSTQTSTSGNASSTGNTGTGGATSGNAGNTNSTNVTVTVNGSCPAGTTPAPANSPAARAAAAGQKNLQFNKQGQLLLPETGTNDTVKTALLAAAGIAGAAALGQFGFTAYRRLANR